MKRHTRGGIATRKSDEPPFHHLPLQPLQRRRAIAAGEAVARVTRYARSLRPSLAHDANGSRVVSEDKAHDSSNARIQADEARLG